MSSSSHTPTAGPSTSKSTSKPWVDPSTLPNDPASASALSSITGNVPSYIKQLMCNTFYAYGVGSHDDSFGYAVGRAVRFVEMRVEYPEERGGRMEAVTVQEVGVTKHMLNGAGMLHGGCVTYLIDNCASCPLVVLGLLTGTNGVGVTQGMNVLFHAPAGVGCTLRITSSSISMGSRIMAARCEITDKSTGRVVASAFLNKMQPVAQAKL
ncbi:HotDog domain-containing protein [Mycena alexandri]|uniref:HotDog domain-containing protein n=1 Tax=Mycena alexandri TaxID=1745969 RepID=A0AAD6RXV5_9AGAR|nr:HotDog domain-containing protein [Mycena alexandri]